MDEMDVFDQQVGGGAIQRLPLARLDQLICMALARPALAELLLTDPEAALASVTDLMQLSDEDRALLHAAQGASDLPELAARLHTLIRQRDDQTRGTR